MSLLGVIAAVSETLGKFLSCFSDADEYLAFGDAHHMDFLSERFNNQNFRRDPLRPAPPDLRARPRGVFPSSTQRSDGCIVSRVAPSACLRILIVGMIENPGRHELKRIMSPLRFLEERILNRHAAEFAAVLHIFGE